VALMDAKISGLFWGDPDLEDQPYQVKLTALWLMTNPRVTLFGYSESTLKRFMFETDLPQDALAQTLDALPKSFVRASEGVWVRNFIRYQIGSGEGLARNKIARSVARELRLCRGGELVGLVLGEYPELRRLVEEENMGLPLSGSPSPRTNAHPIPSASPPDAHSSSSHPHGMGEEKRRVEKSREEKGESRGEIAPDAKPQSSREEEQTRFLEQASRIFGAKKNRAPSEIEMRALAAMREFPGDDEFAVIEAFYRAPVDADGNPRKPESRESLLTNWAKTVDRAETWRREKGISLVPKKNAGPKPWPEGAPEWFAETFPKATPPASWLDVDERVRERFERRAA
jgi:hypothetical protein